MHTRDLKIFLTFSCAGHMAIFASLALMRFSLAQAPEQALFKPAMYCGVMHLQTMPSVLARHSSAPAGEALVPASGTRSITPVSMDYYAKPPVYFSYVPLREPVKSPPITSNVPYHKDPGFTLHPLLPYQFDLYFKDRQEVHIELEFAVTRADTRNFVSLRRKISSGNLEADLLSMRYIGHYLFIQQARFMADVWQTVRIEFSPNTRDHDR